MRRRATTASSRGQSSRRSSIALCPSSSPHRWRHAGFASTRPGSSPATTRATGTAPVINRTATGADRRRLGIATMGRRCREQNDRLVAALGLTGVGSLGRACRRPNAGYGRVFARREPRHRDSVRLPFRGPIARDSVERQFGVRWSSLRRAGPQAVGCELISPRTRGVSARPSAQIPPKRSRRIGLCQPRSTSACRTDAEVAK
jgi:hypothetical protein